MQQREARDERGQESRLWENCMFDALLLSPFPSLIAQATP